jgi:hypothetical protein
MLLWPSPLHPGTKGRSAKDWVYMDNIISSWICRSDDDGMSLYPFVRVVMEARLACRDGECEREVLVSRMIWWNKEWYLVAWKNCERKKRLLLHACWTPFVNCHVQHGIINKHVLHSNVNRQNLTSHLYKSILYIREKIKMSNVS